MAEAVKAAAAAAAAAPSRRVVELIDQPPLTDPAAGPQVQHLHAPAAPTQQPVPSPAADVQARDCRAGEHAQDAAASLELSKPELLSGRASADHVTTQPPANTTTMSGSSNEDAREQLHCKADSCDARVAVAMIQAVSKARGSMRTALREAGTGPAAGATAGGRIDQAVTTGEGVRSAVGGDQMTDSMSAIEEATAGV